MVNSLCLFFMLDASQLVIKSMRRCKKRIKLLQLMCSMSWCETHENAEKNASPSSEHAFQREIEARQSITEFNESQLIQSSVVEN